MMSNAILCQILEHENLLRENGVPDEQIETQIKLLSKIIENNFVSKKDLDILRIDLKNEISLSNYKIKSQIDLMRNDLERIEEHIKILKKII